MKFYILTVMRKLLFAFATSLLLLLLSWQQQPQKANPYGLEIVSAMADYNRLVKKDPSKQLVDLEKVIKGVVLDIRYATPNNFTHQTIYQAPKAFARKPVAEALVKIQTELKGRGLGMKIYDAYRPYAVTLKFFEVYPDTTFVASPQKGSKHNRGCAIDLTLIDLKSGKELEMPTVFDDFTEKATQAYMNLSPEVLKNRQMLREIMSRYGFIPYESEWWHYDYNSWRNYQIMDLSFEELNIKSMVSGKIQDEHPNVLIYCVPTGLNGIRGCFCFL
jgi:D-alanyl-D-alanine dipeptidase